MFTTRHPAVRPLGRRHRPLPIAWAAPVLILSTAFAGVFVADLLAPGLPPLFGFPEVVPDDEPASSPGPEQTAAAALVPLPEVARDRLYAETVPAFFATYCNDCHEGEWAENEIDLAALTDFDDARDARDTLERVVAQVRVGAMPPADHDPLPDAATRAAVADAIAQTALHIDCGVSRDLGSVPTKRLTAFEYANTIRDLLGVEIDVTDVLPNDDSGSGFDNQSESLTLSAMAIERYLDAAERAVAAAFAAGGGALVGPKDYRFYSFRIEDPEYARMTTSGFVEADGRYRLTAKLVPTERTLEKLGLDPSGVFPAARLAEIRAALSDIAITLRVDERPVAERVVDLLLDPRPHEPERDEADAPGEPLLRAEFLAVAEVETDLSAGNHAIDVVGPSDAVRVRGGQFFGPLRPEDAAPPVPADRWRLDDRTPDAFARRFLRRAFRRPPTDAEVTRYASLADDDLRDGAKSLMAAALVSPDFLFRAEAGPDVAFPDGSTGLADHALATRLSYLLWATLPDARLDRLADDGLLHRPETLAAEVDRMLDDPRSAGFVDRFFGQWLGLPNLDAVEISGRHFRGWSSKLAIAAREETRRFAASLVAENRPITDLLDADYTFLNPRLAEVYGVDFRGEDPTDLYYRGPGSNISDYKRRGRRSGVFLHEREFERVPLPPNRRGVLTQASILIQTSNPTGTSPVKRGKWVLETVLGTPPPPAPDGVPELAEGDEEGVHRTLRERLEKHREDPGCASCHALMDPVGFGLENFDAIGRWRDRYRRRGGDGDPVEADGVLADGTEFDGPAAMIAALDRDALRRRFAERLVRYALGRAPLPADRCVVDAVLAAAEQDGYRVRAFVKAVVLGDAFRRIRPPERTLAGLHY